MLNLEREPARYSVTFSSTENSFLPLLFACTVAEFVEKVTVFRHSTVVDLALRIYLFYYKVNASFTYIVNITYLPYFGSL